METKKHHRWLNTKTIVIGLLILLIVILFVVYKISQQRYKPMINPNPKQFINISGKIDPRLHVTFQVVYQTFNEKCRVTDDWFEGAFSPRFQYISYPIKPEKSYYTVQLVLDSYVPGYCNWGLNGVDYSSNYDQLEIDSSLFGIVNKTTENKKQYTIELLCKKKLFDGKKYLNCAPKMNFNNITNKTKQVKINFVLGEN